MRNSRYNLALFCLLAVIAVVFIAQLLSPAPPMMSEIADGDIGVDSALSAEEMEDIARTIQLLNETNPSPTPPPTQISGLFDSLRSFLSNSALTYVDQEISGELARLGVIDIGALQIGPISTQDRTIRFTLLRDNTPLFLASITIQNGDTVERVMLTPL